MFTLLQRAFSIRWHHQVVTSPMKPQKFTSIWPEIGDLPVLAANQFLVQGGISGNSGVPDDMVLTVGHTAPPVLLGTPEEQQAQLAALGAVTTRPLVRVSISRNRLGELIGLLVAAANQWDTMGKEGGDK
jgi:hypothetical protein